MCSLGFFYFLLTYLFLSHISVNPQAFEIICSMFTFQMFNYI